LGLSDKKLKELNKKTLPKKPLISGLRRGQAKTISKWTHILEETRKLYAAGFQQLGLSADLREKVIDILTQQQQELEQKAFEAAQSGTLPDPPSIDAIRAQKAEQEQQLRSVLGDDVYAQFAQFQSTIPDRIIVDELNQEGANLGKAQSDELLQVLTEARQQIQGQFGTTPDLSSMSPDQAIAVVQQRQALLQDTINNRVQNILTPDQQTALQAVLSRLNNGPNPRWNSRVRDCRQG
jgi:hypothetical protein